MPQKPITDDVGTMFESMVATARQKLTEIDSEITSANAQISASSQVSYTDCFNMICEKLKMQRDSDLKDLDSLMKDTSYLGSHEQLTSISVHGDGSTSLSKRARSSFSLYALSQTNIACALLTDATIEAYAKAAAKRFGCLEATPNTATLAASRELATHKLERLYGEKMRINKRVASLLFAEAEVQKPAPGTSAPDSPNKSKITITRDGKPADR